MKKVKVISPQSDSAKIIETSATTWGELKSDLSTYFSDLDNMKAIVRETRNSLESDLAVLPETDFTVILSMKKIASGSDEEVTRYGKPQLLELKTKLNNLIDDIISYQEKSSEGEKELTEEDKKTLEELKSEGLL